MLGGVAAMSLLKRPEVSTSGSENAPTPASDVPRSALEGAIAETIPVLPRAPHIDAVVEAVWLAAGPEALRTSVGPVPGIASSDPASSVTRRNDGGVWFPALRRVLSGVAGRARDPLSLALDAAAPSASLVRFAYSGHLSGFHRYSLVVRRDDGTARLSAIDFSLDLADRPRPSAGVAVVRIGRLGVRLSVESREGERLTPADAVAARSSDGSVDMASLERHLQALTRAYRAIRMAIVYVDPDMPLGQLVPLLVRLREAPDQDRFPSLRLSPR